MSKSGHISAMHIGCGFHLKWIRFTFDRMTATRYKMNWKALNVTSTGRDFDFKSNILPTKDTEKKIGTYLLT